MNETKTPKILLQEEVISNLIHNKEYFEGTFPFLKSDFFDYDYQIIFDHIKLFYKEYRNSPTLKELILTFKDSSKSEKDIIKSKVQEFKKVSDLNADFLIDLTESFIKRKIYEKAIITGAEGLGSNSEDKITESFKLAEESVKVTLKSDLGISFDEVDKLDFEIKKGLLTQIPSFDKILGSGYLPGTLNSAMAPSGVGKTASLIAFACNFASQGRDVVFISMEQSESELYKRMYSNLLGLMVNEISDTPKENIKILIEKIMPDLGKIVVKQYPAKRMTPIGISGFLDKLKNEKNISNPILFVDYLGLLKSDLMRNMDNSYSYIGSLSEELRAVAIERNIIIFSPMQLNRSAYGNLEAGAESMSESMKVMHTIDSAFLILQTQEMKEANKMKIVFTKNRYSGITKSFDIGFDYNHFMFDDKFFIGSENITETSIADNDLEDVFELSKNILSNF